MYPKLVFNRLKVMENFTFIYTPWAPSSKKFLNKLSIHMWLMFIHVRQCGAFVCKLWMNQDSTKNEPKIN
jgi:hypothetical protein